MAEKDPNRPPRLNALTHGGRSKQLLVGDEKQEDFDRLNAGWRAEFEMEDQAGESLLGRVILNDWLLRRAERNYLDLEAKLAAIEPLDWSLEQHKKLELFLRYKTTAERSFGRFFNMLRGLRKDRIREEFTLENLRKKFEAIVEGRETKSRPGPEKAQAAKAPEAFFRGQDSPKKQRKIVTLEQWVEVTVKDGKSVHPCTTGGDVCASRIVKTWQRNKRSGAVLAGRDCGAGGERKVDSRVLPGTEYRRAFVLLVAAPFAGRRANVVCLGGDEAAGGSGYREVGTGAGERRGAAHSIRCRQLACGIRGVAGSAVISLPASVRVYLCTVPCDMRRSFDGLHGLVTSVMELDALAGHLFVFSNRKSDRVKIFYWDHDGFAIWSKRLGGRHVRDAIPRRQRTTREITSQELSALLSGIDLSQAKRRKRYERKSNRTPHKNIVSVAMILALKSAGCTYNRLSADRSQQPAERSRDLTADAGRSHGATGQNTASVTAVTGG